MRKGINTSYTMNMFTLFLCLAMIFTSIGAQNVWAIGAGEDPPTEFYAIWDNSAKSISFAAEEPTEGTYEKVTGVKDFIRSHKDEVKTIDFGFTNAAGESEKIVLGENEADQLFANCSQLTTTENLTNLDTSKATTMYGMFSDCTNLTSLDLSAFDTSNVTNMSYMFRNCEALTDLNLSSFDTGNVTDMSFMFRLCSSLTELDLSHFDTSKVTNMEYMFCRCYGANTINVSSFDTSNVTDMECMFYRCDRIRAIDVSSFDTSKVSDMYIMFAYCYALEELDLSNFDTSSISYSSGYPGLTGLAIGCRNLKTIDVSNMTTNTGSKTLQNSFAQCYKLEKITFGENIVLAHYSGGYAPCGLSGNWEKEDEPGVMLTTSDLIEKYANASTREKATFVRFMPEGHYYRTDGSLNQDNMWEVHSPDERFKGYCLNKFRSGVSQFLDRVQITNDAQLKELLDSNVSEASLGYAPLGNSMEEALVTLLYYGWPNDKAGIQAKYGLSDDEYMEVTQNAIWDFVDRYDNKSGPENQTPAMINAYNELLDQRYANIPEKYELYIYTTWDKQFQNLISIRGLTDGIYGGVEVYKQDEHSAPLSGAEFTVYKLDGTPVKAMTSGDNGYASICETDSYQGLPAGDYYVKETKAPAGYSLSDSRFYFSITTSNELVTLGKPSSSAAERLMIFTDEEDTSYKGGGISVKKESSSGDALVGAEFTIYQDGNEVMTIISDEEGIAKTGTRDLPLGSYTIKESKAPAGYVASDEEKSFAISTDSEFLEKHFTFTNKAKKGEVTIDASKLFKNGKLNGDDFTFQLQTMDGEVLQEVKNDKDGKVTFDPIEYTAEDQGYTNYKIVEVKGQDEAITYDEHEEIVTVTIIDTGADELECTATYDEDGPIFTNTKKPYIEKTINHGDEVVIKSRSEKVIYTINTVVPHDIKNFKVIDELPSALEFADKESFTILVDGENSDLDFSIKGDTFTLELNENLIKEYFGSEIEIEFSARIKDDADLSKYKVGDKYSINNIATCIIDNKERISSLTEGATLKILAKDASKKKMVKQVVRALATRTGDNAPMLIVAIILVIAAIALIATHSKKKK